jgi:hypothetical protein
MLYVFFAVIGLFFCSGTIKSMDDYRSDVNHMSAITWSGHEAEVIDFVKNSIVTQESKEKTKKHVAQGVDSIVINGCTGENGMSRMQVRIAQISDDNQAEELTIQADKNSFSYIIVNHDGAHLDIGLRLPDQAICPSRDIVIFLALKKYAKIVTNNYVDTTFLSPINSENLHISVASGATMRLPSIKARTIELLVKENSSLVAQDKARLKAKDLLFIYREGSSKIELGVKTKLLQVQSNGKGAITLKGVATKQELRFLEGSLFAMGLKSEEVRMAVVKGSGEIELCAESVKGVVPVKSNYDITCCVPSKDSLCIYPAEPL